MNKKQNIEKIIKELNSNNFLQEIIRNIKYYIEVEKYTDSKIKNWYNKRNDDFTGKDLNKWEHLTKKYLEESVQSNMLNPIFDKVWRSRFGDFELMINSFPTNLNSIYISDYIMFNPNCNLTFDQVDRILPYIKFKKIDSDTCQIDRWIFTSKGFYMIDSVQPNYEITWLNLDNTDTMEGIKTEEDKWYAIRALLQIMNDTPDKYVNFNSYQIIGNWYHKNDNWLVSWIPNNYRPINKNQISLVQSDLSINLEGRLNQDELIRFLYSNALFGGKDLEKIGIKSESNSIYNILINLVKSTCNKITHFIDKIKDAQINVQIDLDMIDLTEYVKINGEERTIILIDEINQTIKYRYNCKNVLNSDSIQITKEELLTRMYNMSLPFGIGLIDSAYKVQTDDGRKLMEVQEATKILYESDSQYIDYLYGVPIKTVFSQFPIINYHKFDEYNGTEAFNKCISSIKINLNK